MEMNLRVIGIVISRDVCGESCGMIQSIVPYRKNDSIPITRMPDDFVRQ
jgi:hypothetical protein